MYNIDESTNVQNKIPERGMLTRFFNKLKSVATASGN